MWNNHTSCFCFFQSVEIPYHVHVKCSTHLTWWFSSVMASCLEWCDIACTACTNLGTCVKSEQKRSSPGFVPRVEHDCQVVMRRFLVMIFCGRFEQWDSSWHSSVWLFLMQSFMHCRISERFVYGPRHSASESTWNSVGRVVRLFKLFAWQPDVCLGTLSNTAEFFNMLRLNQP